MLKQALNELEIGLTLLTDSPLLIKDGRFGDEDRKKVTDREKRNRMPMAVPISRSTLDTLRKAALDTNPVDAVSKLDFFLPATSLRGAWRSYLERTLRGLDSVEKPRVCDPLAVGRREDNQGDEDDVVVNARDASCSNVLELEKKAYSKQRPEKRKLPYHPYAHSCPVCRLFGSTVQASRISVSDGERVAGTGSILVREHVRINRHTGQVQGAPLKFFALQNYQFKVTIRLKNFEDWQVFLSGLLLDQLGAGLIPVGSGKSKGYGYVKARIDKVLLTTFSLQDPPDTLPGIAEHASSSAQAASYGLQAPKKEIPLPPGEWKRDETAFWRCFRELTPEEFQATWKQIPFQWNFELLESRKEYA